MKFAKLNFKTKEGLSLANFQDGWSMEWGEGGSYHCDILFNGKKVAEAIEEGNGGILRLDFENRNHEEVDNAVLSFLKRVDKSYDKYEWLRSKTKVSEDDYACMIAFLIDTYDIKKRVRKYFKKGYKLVASAIGNYETEIFASFNSNQETMLAHIKGQKNYDKESIITFYTEESIDNDI